MPGIAENLLAVRASIDAAERKASRHPGSVSLLAVSKKCLPEAVREAFAFGQREFGENYVQEGLEKIAALADLPINWHFIGPIQSNKTRSIASAFAWVHAIDRLKIAERLAEQRDPALPPLNVCLQVNVSGEESKSGVTPDELPPLALAVAALPNLSLRGLMCIPEPTEDEILLRGRFRLLGALLADLRRLLPHAPLDTLSMGMSGDMSLAVAEGATIVRVGTAIFGARPRKVDQSL
ncbi:MAG: YggS family pyridoxal phosphate-dependent enzyme [Candidatus Dactylopiibacterium carminicum]|uniref:Pyridoxal phosphate homeostasis protein n=1 Tax=Candidatus Dactylopiibacterium carminicum TaxID=857335 RepID=A0A272EQN9_9RHOO|nr:YggS family pyridoxal phosphate-dependent enzyme [Candidatus Dactylopiibacterium carminicum]KAF7598302.1 YggS family pyridoxal phosphate-dependent enzyme [Candidatus Dactylopiibacterium carminicum]PAS92030.1 MAG: YggS family pyridoxal phosphate-dependent enzyme [Candidatus Dactylopiibacterium carminicum]PAS97299.1 MAG: YggS family pyridoxal phosphate enzyme [Candidatus Dactylopiibacterium carminicum]